MEVPERYLRWIGPAVRERVAAQAKVANESWMQDWPCEVADVTRMPDFLAGYRVAENDDERFAWMCLCLESIEFSERGIEAYWEQVEPLLMAAPRVHAHSILSWAGVGSCADGRWRFDVPYYALSRFMRPLFLECRAELAFDEFDAACVPSAEETGEIEHLLRSLGDANWLELAADGRSGLHSVAALEEFFNFEGVAPSELRLGDWEPTMLDAVTGGEGVGLLDVPMYTEDGASAVVVTVCIERLGTGSSAPRVTLRRVVGSYVSQLVSPIVGQRIRNRIIEYLELVSSFDALREYQQAVPYVNVPYEVVEQWKDWGPEDPNRVRPVDALSDDEVRAMRAFHAVWDATADAIPDDYPRTAHVQGMPRWAELREQARLALEVFSRRRRWPEE